MLKTQISHTRAQTSADPSVRVLPLRVWTQTEGGVILDVFLQLLELGATAVACTPNWEWVISLGKHSCPAIFVAMIVPTTAFSFHLTVATCPYMSSSSTSNTSPYFCKWCHVDTLQLVYLCCGYRQLTLVVCDAPPEKLKLPVVPTASTVGGKRSSVTPAWNPIPKEQKEPTLASSTCTNRILIHQVTACKPKHFFFLINQCSCKLRHL